MCLSLFGCLRRYCLSWQIDLLKAKLVAGEITDFTKKRKKCQGRGRGVCSIEKCGEAINLTRTSRIKCGFNLLYWSWDDNVLIVNLGCVCVCVLNFKTLEVM